MGNFITKYKRRIYIIKYTVMIVFFIFVLGIIFVFNGLFEKGAVKSEIENFKQRGVFVKEVILQGQNVSYYKIPKKYNYEETDRHIYDIEKYSECYIGSKTDIILTSRNPLRMYGDAIVRDISGVFARNFFIGHATINITEDGSSCIESVGNDNGYDGVRITENNWIDTEVRYGNDAQIILGLRLKSTTSNQREKICKDLKELVGKRYNHLFIFYSRNKYYCTDLISRVLRKNEIKINYDSFYTTGNDLIVSNKTYLIFVCERVKEGYFNIYYLNGE